MVSRLSFIIPTLDEEQALPATLAALQACRRRGHEVVVADGGSRDATIEVAAPLADQVLRVGVGRAVQMNAGARAATGDVLLFLHADTVLPSDTDRYVLEALSDGGACEWGRFDVRLTGQAPLLRVVETLMNLRSRLTGIATGDQAVFVRREAFAAVGGFPLIELMEDVALSRALRRRSRPACLRQLAITSSRRWERHGILRTILKMWCLRLAYALGVPPAVLSRHYGSR